MFGTPRAPRWDDDMQSERLEKGVLRETVALYLLTGAYAVFTTIIGAVLVLLVDEFVIPLSRGGVFIAWQNIGSLAGIFLSGFVIDRYDKRWQIVVAYTVFAVLMAGVYFTSTMTAYIVMIALAGFASKITDALLNAVTAELHVRNKGFYMNLLHCSYGIGSFCGPVYAGFLIESRGSWRLSYLLLGVVYFALIALYALMNVRRAARTAVSAADKASDAGVASFRSIMTPRMLLASLALIFYCGHQVGVNNWLPVFLTESVGADAVTAGSGVSAFWLGLIFGRFSCSFLTRKYYEKHLLLIGNTAGGVLFIVCMLIGGKTLLFLGAFAAGILAGATIPMILTLAYTWYPRAQGKISMVLFLAISIGGVIVPWLMGVIEGVAGLRAAMVLDGAALLISAGLVLALPRKGT